MGELQTAERMIGVLQSDLLADHSGFSVEGSVIVQRQDANCVAYEDRSITATKLLLGAIDPPPWAFGVIDILNRSTGDIAGWVRDVEHPRTSEEYAFGDVTSVSNSPPRPRLKTRSRSGSGFSGENADAPEKAMPRKSKTADGYLNASRESDDGYAARAQNVDGDNDNYGSGNHVGARSTSNPFRRFTENPELAQLPPNFVHNLALARQSAQRRQQEPSQTTSFHDERQTSTLPFTGSSSMPSHIDTPPPYSSHSGGQYVCAPGISSPAPVRAQSEKTGLHTPIEPGAARAIALYDFDAQEVRNLIIHRLSSPGMLLMLRLLVLGVGWRSRVPERRGHHCDKTV